MSQSEIARIRQQIALEYQSAQCVFGKFTQKGKHEFYTNRQEQIAVYFEELRKIIPVEEAMVILIEESNRYS